MQVDISNATLGWDLGAAPVFESVKAARTSELTRGSSLNNCEFTATWGGN